MEKVYKVRLYRIVLNLVFSALGLFVIWLFFGSIFSPMVNMIVGISFYLIYIYLVIYRNYITVIVTDRYLIVKKGSDEREFEIANCSFYAESNTSNGETSCDLVVTEKNGEKTYIDFELIGVGQFRELLDDLGVTAKVQKLKTKKK